MLKIIKQDKNIVLNNIKNKHLDAIEMSSTNLVDSIILSMGKNGILDCLGQGLEDKRRHNTTIPLKSIITLAVASKMKVKTSLSDIPYAIQDHRTMAELGYNMLNKDDGLMRESTVRAFLDKYISDDFINYYNDTVQQHIFPIMDVQPNIHVLDCTKIKVNIKNYNYENVGFNRDNDGKRIKGYKLSCLRGVVDDTGIIEDIRFDPANIHDMKLSKEMLKTTPCLKEDDILIMDRGFLSRTITNYLKTERGVDTYIPLRKNMQAHDMAVGMAILQNEWEKNPKYKNQHIVLVKDMGDYWHDNKVYSRENDVPINACVIWYKETNGYAVIITTDLTKSAKQIIQTYCLRPEIEEDFRQLKDYWKLEDFKSTKYHVITFHIVCTLFGYLFYQLYRLLSDGEEYIGKSLPIVLKNYQSENLKHLVFYSGNYFCIMDIIEFAKFFETCEIEVRKLIEELSK